jgi:2-dehydropantoate 2-reductase
VSSASPVVVFGAGAIGCLFSAYLARAPEAVLLIGHRAAVEAIRSKGLRVEGPGSGVFRIRAEERLRPSEPVRGAILAVKTYDADSAARTLAESHREPVPVLLPQNGIGVEEAVRPSLVGAGWAPGRIQLIRAVNSIPATLLGPGHVLQAGSGEIVLEASPSMTHPAVTELFAGPFRRAGLSVRVVEDITREVWRKLLVNAAINPVTADHRVVNGKLAKDPWRGQALELLHEALAVARAEGFEFSDEEAESDLLRVIRATAENRSSMLQDLERGKPTEIDAISGEVVRRARLHGIVVPRTERIFRRLASAGRTAPAKAL